MVDYIGKDRTGDVICVPTLKGECNMGNIECYKTEEQCDKEVTKEVYLREK